MIRRTWCVLFFVLAPVLITAWRSTPSERREVRELRRNGIHYHSKRHMLPNQSEPKRRSTTPKPRELRKKPSGHLIPLEEDDIDNDEIVSVAIGPPPMRPKFDKAYWKHPPKPINHTSNPAATNLVRDILTQLGREFLTSQVSEDFVFGQYVGNAMKNLTTELRLKMQHEVLELVVKYQKINRGEITVKVEVTTSETPPPLLREARLDKKFGTNETEDTWPDFSNLAKIVG